jgi:hypothetical protein
MNFARDGYLASRDPVLRLCGPVVNEPQVGVRGAGPCGDPIAEARMDCVWLVRIMIPAVVDENLKCLGGGC